MIYECPRCGGDDLAVEYVEHGTAYIDAEGSVGDYRGGDMEWDDDAPIRCVACLEEGTVKKFLRKE